MQLLDVLVCLVSIPILTVYLLQTVLPLDNKELPVGPQPAAYPPNMVPRTRRRGDAEARIQSRYHGVADAVEDLRRKYKQDLRNARQANRDAIRSGGIALPDADDIEMAYFHRDEL